MKTKCIGLNNHLNIINFNLVRIKNNYDIFQHRYKWLLPRNSGFTPTTTNEVRVVRYIQSLKRLNSFRS